MMNSSTLYYHENGFMFIAASRNKNQNVFQPKHYTVWLGFSKLLEM